TRRRPRARSPPRWPSSTGSTEAGSSLPIPASASAAGQPPQIDKDDPASVWGVRTRYPRLFRLRTRALLLLTAVLGLCPPAGARAEEEAPSLTHALFLEKTAHDPE